jgi:hypothetical protein
MALRLEGKIALVTGGSSGNWTCNSEAVHQRRRIRVHHGPTPGGTR